MQEITTIDLNLAKNVFQVHGYNVKLILPLYVKPFVKRQKNDAADVKAICEAAL